MKNNFVGHHLILAALLATSSSFAANFGAPVMKAAAASATPAAAAVLPTASGPQVSDTFRVVKTDGATIIQQGTMSSSVASIPMLTVSESDALAKGVGKCAFNVKYDEISATAASGTTNQIYSNDKLIAINSMIAVAPGVIKTIWTQPYLFAGLNNVRVVVNSAGVAPSTKWIRVYVSGTCGGTTATSTTTTVTPTTTTTTRTTTTTTVKAPVVVSYVPGSAEWNNLNIVYGYSNYAVTQLKGKGYARYDELVKLNIAVTAAINAKSVTQGAYNSLMTGWNTFVTDPVFKAMMSAVTPPTNAK
jgi:hypothetical protein